MAATYELTFDDYLSIIRRRAVHLVTIFVGILAVAVVVAVAIPPLYQSYGIILVESQQIPKDMVQTTITGYADERIEIIKQRVMTRENLLKVIDKYKLFAGERKPTTASERIDELRSRISIEPISVDIKGKRREQATIAFKLSFEHRQPEMAFKVANELITLFLDENVKARTERATETTEFLTSEADKLKLELETLENQVAAYKQRHGSALPEHLGLHMNMVSRTESEIREIERDQKAAQEELRFLELELAAARSGNTAAARATNAGSASAPVREVDRLKSEYARLTAIYTEAHPDVRAVKRKIEALEAVEPPAPVAGVNPVETASLEVARIQAKIAATNNRINSLAAQSQALRGKLVSYERQIMQTPQVERGLAALMRDYENAQKKYEEIRAKQMSAQIAENLEEENKAERFALLEPPLMPEKPVKPDRMKIMLLGTFMAIGGSGGLVFMLEMLNQRIRGVDTLAALTSQRPLAAIPYITTKDEISRRKRRLWLLVILLLLAIAASAALVHFTYMSLDILLLKLISRFG